MSDPAVAWSQPPVDDVGYISSEQMLRLSDEDLFALVVRFEETRYTGWRNYKGNWRRVLRMDKTRDSKVLDYGCGVGIEGLQYARKGNAVASCDIVPTNIELANRVLGLMVGRRVVPRPPYDVIHSAGVIHHIPDAVGAVELLADLLRPGGQLRLMLYSDFAWRIATGTEPPRTVIDHPDFLTYVRRWDGVGDYADWYDRARIEERFGEWFKILDFQYLTEHSEYLGCVLEKL